jgi:hypothetical protein
LWAFPKIINLDVQPTESKVDLIISFDERYDGMVSRKSVNNVKKVILNDALIDQDHKKELLDSRILETVDFVSYDTRVEILLYLNSAVNIAYKQIDDGFGILLRVSKSDKTTPKVDEDEIVPGGKSAFDSVSGGYILTLVSLLGVVIILFILKKRIESKKSKEVDDDSLSEMDLLLKNERSNSSLLQKIEPPDFDFKKRPQKKKKIQSNMGDNFPFGAQESYQSPQSYEPEPISKQTSVIFEEDTELGRIAVLQIGKVRYIMLENGSGNVTLLDKEIVKNDEFETPEVRKISRKVEEEEFDIKIPDELSANKNRKNSSESEELQDLFKDSYSLKL